MHHGSSLIGLIVSLAIVIGLIVYVMRLRKQGYSFGENTIVRCSKGHLFTTIWLPGGSLKAVRLGKARFQHCPVGKHWALVHLVKKSDLSSKEIKQAAKYHDSRIP